MATTMSATPISASIPSPPPVATASGLLALLTEPSPRLRNTALQRLLTVVDTLWHEVSESLPDLEALAEDETLDAETRKTAAAVASRVFFHLEEPVQALRLALEGGEENFDVVNDRESLYVETLVSAAVEAYVKKRREVCEAVEEEGGAAGDKGEGEEEEEGGGLDMEKLHKVVQLMMERCYADGQYGHALGVAFEAREVGKVREILERCVASSNAREEMGDNDDEAARAARIAKREEEVHKTLSYALNTAVTLVTSKSFRNEALGIIAEFLKSEFDESGTKGTVGHKASAVSLCRCYQLLHASQPVSEIVTTLLDGSEDDALLGLQLCFDLIDTGDQNFVNGVAAGLPTKGAGDGSGSGAAGAAAAANVEVLDGAARAVPARGEMEVNADGTEVAPASGTGAVADEGAIEAVVEAKDGSGGPASSKKDSEDAAASTAKKDRNDEIWSRFDSALKIMTGGFSCELALSFLHKNSDSDRLIMENLKKSLEDRSSGSGRNSVLHNCAVSTHAYLNAGTTNDGFLRDHLDWMKKASNWAKFSATASLGVVHAGHTTEAMTLLEPYLPPSQDGGNAAADGGANAGGGGGGPTVSSSGGYAEGGSLFALGLIHGSHAGSSSTKRRETSTFLRNHLRASHANEVISHGAALAVGLTAFGTSDLEVVNELKELLYTDSAVAGEAAGMAIGMVLVGSGAGNTNNDNEELLEVVSELKNYARETQHEKIIRGIAVGMALINYGQEENADAVIEEMRGDRDPILRYGAQYAIALAYCGTGSNKAIRILLHTAVSDVSDDVRMAAVIGLAFVLYKTPERVPQLVKLLLESFNPHVRYASCMAVGIAMAGSGDPESVALLEPMIEDMTDFVRQGALLGTAMIYMQQPDICNGRKIKSFREKLVSIVGDKHQSTLTKMGAILSTGVIDAGGRNCSLDLGSRNGFTKMTSAVGLALWLQHWHWFPMMHMISLALTPTYTIGLNKDFKYPKNFEIQCNAKPSVFAYPKRLEEKKEEKKKRVETVTLSTTAKNKARLARKRAKEEAEAGGGDAAATSMEVDDDTKDTKDVAKAAETKEVTTEAEKSAAAEKEEGGGESMDIDTADNANAAAASSSEEGKKSSKKKSREPEPTSFRITNPSRITKSQSEYCVFDLTQRYRPIRPEERPIGVILLTDSTPDVEDENLAAVKAPSLEDEENEAEAPEPFEWAPPGHPEYVDPSSSATAGAAAGENGDNNAAGGGDDAGASEGKEAESKSDSGDDDDNKAPPSSSE